MLNILNNTANYWINHLQLAPHPEGGYYKETFRSKNEIIRVNESEKKNACTSIYYLLEGYDFSGFHRLKSDEIWYFHKGEPIFIHIITSKGNYDCIELSDSSSGQLQAIVEANCWFAANIPSKSGFSLASCAVAPGFDFVEFEMAKKTSLLAEYPEHEAIVKELCRD
ncbi:cupin domain-containing protein [Pedobacter psychrodurus]|uniref:Cupin domain-containing protein n=1 Tax=Pedobacter psychrodurus TaxID=2530456 RepID=A0A4R0Q647_9SPHI|nr:cupin domain-containing protein [Pedobacter psychrodurus]TCD28659.1 cupin domain-containing protein [Pedobacter psychrodurus]